ncbi:hypothetical protein [uncultured Granulicatella sp.]|uniref:hypothetical protein n=1 Tax=uncultured Granulicatella sp. TaxID=316089 RepID=UPI0028D25553|nr:hypothetical protein [uncultured Granulicatella sp.]
MKLSKKAILLWIAILSVVVVSAVVIYRQQQQKTHEAQIEKQISFIQDNSKKFGEQKERSDKLKLLTDFLKEFEKYEKSDPKEDKVINQYKSSLADMRKYFTDAYNKTLEENTLSDIDTQTDKNKISQSKVNLETLNTTVQKETGIVLPSNKSKEFVEKIDNQVQVYSKRIEAIEAEEKAKVERLAAEKRVKTHYENEYFSIDVPEEWADKWTVTEDNKSQSGITCKLYMFSYNDGGVAVYIADMRGVTRGSLYGAIPSDSVVKTVGKTSSGVDVFKTEAGSGFFTRGAKITLK